MFRPPSRIYDRIREGGRHVKRFLFVVIAALALAPAASAKEILGLQLCGADGCATDKHPTMMEGPAGPLSADAQSATPAKLGAWFRGSVLMGDHGKVYGRMPFYFVPDGSRIALPGNAGQTTAWEYATGQTKATLEALAARLKPFPTPTITRVSLNARNAEDPQSYARIYTVGGKAEGYPSDLNSIQVVLESKARTPWTDGNYVVLYPKARLLVRDGQIVSIPGDVADAAAAGQSLDLGRAFPWVSLLVGLAVIALVAGLLVRFRPRPSPHPVPQA
jgi:hypothetical protein